MSRVAPALTVSDDERIVLLRWSKGRRTPARLVRRAKIVLRAADGWLTAASAVELGTQEKTVGLWRRRLAAQGPAGIEQDASGRGRPAPVQRGVIEADVVRKTTRERPPHATHWSTRSMAAALGISPASGRRIWKRHGLKPHLVRTFKVSNAPTSRRNWKTSSASLSTRPSTPSSFRSMRRARFKRSTARSLACRSRQDGQAR